MPAIPASPTRIHSVVNASRRSAVFCRSVVVSIQVTRAGGTPKNVRFSHPSMPASKGGCGSLPIDVSQLVLWT